MNTDELLAYYKDYFSSLENYDFTKNFVLEEKENGKIFVGKITSKLAKLPLEIDIKIPFGFPNEKISLTTTLLRNYPHLIANKDESSWFCLNTPFGETIEEQLNLEIERLSGWIEKYLNNEEKHESPPNAYRNPQFQLFYNEEQAVSEQEIRIKNACWGQTDCYCRGKYYYPLNLGNNSIQFNDVFKNKDLFTEKKLFWFFTSMTPVMDNGSLPDNTKDLGDFFKVPIEFEKAFKEEYNISLIEPCVHIKPLTPDEMESLLNHVPTDDEIYVEDIVFAESEKQCKDALIAIGFKFKNEIIWELAKVLPIQEWGLDVSKGSDIFYRLKWMKTTNINFERYFGRGHFCDQLTNANITIIGIGAIGSSLAEILTRGGVNNITLIDNDAVEHGNVCRSIYSFTDVGKSKVEALGNKLEEMSPFLNVGVLKANIYSEVNYRSKGEIYNILSNANIVFDCTASNELLHCLSILDLPNPIISLGITNEARDLICVTNSSDNLFEKRKFYLSQLEHETENLYYEGIGCYTPTFKANYADINSLLNLATKQIDKVLSEKENVDSFILSYTDFGIKQTDIVTLHQPELEFTLSISQQCLDEIRKYSEDNLPNEFGGYLFGGYSRNRRHVYLTNVIVSKKTRSGFSFFQAIDNSSAIQAIKDIFEKTKGLINYIGEWHSHPSMSNHYSATDFDSIKKQALSDDIYTNNPLMCIVSITKSRFEPLFYIYYEDKLYPFEKI